MSAPTQQEVDGVVAAYKNAKTAVEYSATIVLEMQQNSGTDYTMVWNGQYPTE